MSALGQKPTCAPQ